MVRVDCPVAIPTRIDITIWLSTLSNRVSDRGKNNFHSQDCKLFCNITYSIRGVEDMRGDTREINY